MTSRRSFLVRVGQAIAAGLASPALLQLVPSTPVLEPFTYNGVSWVVWERCLPQTMILYVDERTMKLYNSLLVEDRRYRAS